MTAHAQLLEAANQEDIEGIVIGAWGWGSLPVRYEIAGADTVPNVPAP